MYEAGPYHAARTQTETSNQHHYPTANVLAGLFLIGLAVYEIMVNSRAPVELLLLGAIFLIPTLRSDDEKLSSKEPDMY